MIRRKRSPKPLSFVLENERYKDSVNNIKSCVDPDKEKTVQNIHRLLPLLKAGYGGSHVWISNQQNERIGIIYY